MPASRCPASPCQDKPGLAAPLLALPASPSRARLNRAKHDLAAHRRDLRCHSPPALQYRAAPCHPNARTCFAGLVLLHLARPRRAMPQKAVPFLTPPASLCAARPCQALQLRASPGSAVPSQPCSAKPSRAASRRPLPCLAKPAMPLPPHRGGFNRAYSRCARLVTFRSAFRCRFQKTRFQSRRCFQGCGERMRMPFFFVATITPPRCALRTARGAA